MEVTLIFPHQLFSFHPAIARNRQIFIVEDPLFFGDQEFPVKFHKQKILLHKLSIDNYCKILKNNNYDVKILSYKSFSDKEYLKKVYAQFLEVKSQYPSCVYDPPRVLSCATNCPNPLCPGELLPNRKYSKMITNEPVKTVINL